jgi:hypothetical protein
MRARSADLVADNVDVSRRLSPWRKAVAVLQATAATGLLVLSISCHPERNPTRAQLEERSVNAAQTKRETPETIAPESHSVNEADLVLRACGPPSTDSVHDVYSKEQDGPVRTLFYGGSQPLYLDFIPRHPPVSSAQQQVTELPANTIWVFEQGRAGDQVLLTSHRLAAVLPCAAQALASYE